MTKNDLCVAIVAAIVGTTLTGAATGQVTSANSISLQAKLDGVTGPMTNLTVKFFDALTAGVQVGSTITLNNVAVQNGIVSVPISPVDAAVFNGQTRYMEFAVNGTTLVPRELVTSVPYALSVPIASTLSFRRLNVGADRPGEVSNLTVAAEFSGRNNVEAANFPIADSGIGGQLGLAINYKTAPGHFDILHAYSAGIDQAAPLFRVSSTGEINGSYMLLGSRSAGQAEVFEVDASYNGRDHVSSAKFIVQDGARPPYGLDINYLWNHLNGGTDVLRVARDGLTVFAVNDIGETTTKVLTITGADVAEPFNVAQTEVAAKPMPGMVMSIDPANPGKLMVSSTPYDTKVAGAISGAGGLSVGVVMGKDNPDPFIKGDHPVAMSGRVYVWCDASSGAIEPGDMLTTSSTPGHAMKAVDQTKAFGAVIGKSMTGLKEGKGLVLVLVNLQ